MARHDTPAIYFKAFILLAMFPAVEHYILVFVADKKVYPVYHCKTYKVKAFLVVEFIFCAHYCLNVHYKRYNAKTERHL
jgi:hypothetical protein